MDVPVAAVVLQCGIVSKIARDDEVGTFRDIVDVERERAFNVAARSRELDSAFAVRR